MAVKDYQEIWNALATAFEALSELTDELATDTIFTGMPIAKTSFPYIIFNLSNMRPQYGGGNSPGIHRPDIELGIFGPDRAQLRKIDAILQQNFVIPSRRAADISSTNYRMRVLKHLDSVETPTALMLFADDEPCFKIASLWQARINEK